MNSEVKENTILALSSCVEAFRNPNWSYEYTELFALFLQRSTLWHTAAIWQGWAIVLSENVRSLFLKSEKSAIRKFTLFPHIFAHPLFLKERLCDRYFGRSLQKSDTNSDRTIDLLKRATKKGDRTIALLKRAKMCDEPKCECAIAQSCNMMYN